MRCPLLVNGNECLIGVCKKHLDEMKKAGGTHAVGEDLMEDEEAQEAEQLDQNTVRLLPPRTSTSLDMGNRADQRGNDYIFLPFCEQHCNNPSISLILQNCTLWTSSCPRTLQLPWQMMLLNVNHRGSKSKCKTTIAKLKLMNPMRKLAHMKVFLIIWQSRMISTRKMKKLSRSLWIKLGA
jgi:hypothetical protein